MKALILCAGKGTRLRPITNKIPKCMVRVGDKPVLEHLVDHLYKFGITEIIVNLHHIPEPVYKYFGDRLMYFYEQRLLGEAHTIRRLTPWLGNKFVVMNGDTLTDIDIEAVEICDNALVEAWDTKGEYTGTKMYNLIKGKGVSRLYIDCNWIDIGTKERLAKARRDYKEKKLNNLSNL